eukprot:3464474-Rhodomonas_salina.1
MASLKKAMKWDEEAFGLEYDLDVFHIVAVNDFNMGPCPFLRDRSAAKGLRRLCADDARVAQARWRTRVSTCSTPASSSRSPPRPPTATTRRSRA